MFQVNYLNKISPVGTALWTEDYRVSDCLEDAQALVVRSAPMQEMSFSENLLAVARAGSPFSTETFPILSAGSQRRWQGRMSTLPD